MIRRTTVCFSFSFQYPGAQEVSHVGGDAVDRFLVAIQREGRIWAQFVLAPETGTEAIRPVAQPIEEAGRHIVRLLMNELAGHSLEGMPREKHLLLAPKVVERVPLVVNEGAADTLSC